MMRWPTPNIVYLDEVLVEELGLGRVEEHEDHHVQHPERGEDGGDEPHQEEEEGPERVVVRHVLQVVCR